MHADAPSPHPRRRPARRDDVSGSVGFFSRHRSPQVRRTVRSRSADCTWVECPSHRVHLDLERAVRTRAYACTFVNHASRRRMRKSHGKLLKVILASFSVLNAPIGFGSRPRVIGFRAISPRRSIFSSEWIVIPPPDKEHRVCVSPRVATCRNPISIGSDGSRRSFVINMRLLFKLTIDRAALGRDRGYRKFFAR